MNHLILLAAGSSRRFGGNKLLAPLNEKPLYTWGLSALNKVCRAREDCTLTVVSRYREIREAAQAVGAQAVDSPDSEKGQAYSIRSGLQALGRGEGLHSLSPLRPALDHTPNHFPPAGCGGSGYLDGYCRLWEARGYAHPVFCPASPGPDGPGGRSRRTEADGPPGTALPGGFDRVRAGAGRRGLPRTVTISRKNLRFFETGDFFLKSA